MNSFKLGLSLLSVSIMSACAQPNPDSGNSEPVNTGSQIFEEQVSMLAPEEVVVGNEYYITASALRVRSTPSTDNNDNILGEIKRNEKVKVLSAPVGDFVQIEILSTDSDIREAGEYYTAYYYLDVKKSAKKARRYPESKLSEYFMIQNLATEKIRVYKRGCESGDCAHTMLFETDAAVGEDDKSTRSILGHFHITSWHKFYQDGAGRYPSWYDPNYPRVPKPGAAPTDWFDREVMPYSSANMRGAFGWFTAKVGPDAASQWTHGTIGWGEDGKDYIEATRGFWANLFADPRSQGCTRTDNESIAYIRHLLPVGSTLIKVYAREALGDPSLSKYVNQGEKAWEYILTKNGVRRDGQQADKYKVKAARTPASRYLEVGSVGLDRMPTTEVFLSGSSGAKSNKNGNYYALKHGDMTGAFLIDEGRLVKYRHPTGKLRVGGYKTVLFPAGLTASPEKAFRLPACKRKYLPLDKNSRRQADSRLRRTAGRCATYLDQNGKFYYKGK